MGAVPGRSGHAVGLTRPWAVARLRAAAASLHGRDVDWSARSVTWCEVTAPAVVVGSTQGDEAIAPGARMEVARRRSGGGAVLVEPGRVVWADVVVPAADPLWEPDVGRATWWLGEAWAAALGDLGVAGAEVHRGGLVRSAWSTAVCFAGLGPGEVTADGRKVVGIAQRRTRDGALFQCAVALAWDPAPLLAALALSPGDREVAAADLAGAVAPVTAPAAAVEAALLAHLP